MSEDWQATVFHDYFAIRGGGERLVLTLAEALDAEIVCGYRTADTFDAAMFPASLRDLNLPQSLRRPGLRPLALSARFARERSRAAQGKLRIFSGVAAPLAAPKRAHGACNIFYCHTPPRFLFDQRAHFVDALPAAQRLAAIPLLAAYERAYRHAIARMDVIVANSENTRARIRQYLDRDSIVVHPPCDTERFIWRGQKDYFLSTARLAPLKRVDRIVTAFRDMPDKNLVVVSGGSELPALRRLAAGARNIDIRGWVAEDELHALIGNAIATIYLAEDEDFGMSPVESMAAGKPVIGVSEGGLLETVIPEETGILVPAGAAVADLADAVGRLTPARALAMRSACEARAAHFSREKFIDAMKAVIRNCADGLHAANGRQ
ncbi:MAG: glycosyl transferase family 1 [Ahrensia sp.]|nr:glycosyl transferase family 1 [Ahrensia sp.]|tara:strand:- start:33318 stop:34451 length:1134 start_codon:yes stop_codon:yes gene_type:complete